MDAVEVDPGELKELGDGECSRKETSSLCGFGGVLLLLLGFFYLFISSEKNILQLWELLLKQPQDERGWGGSGARGSAASPLNALAARMGSCVLSR